MRLSSDRQPCATALTPKGKWHQFLITALALITGLTANGAELHFSNGDKLTGEVIRRDDGKIHFRSPVLGDLIIAESEAVIIEAPETPVESLAGLPPAIEQVRLRDAESTRPDVVKAPPPPAWKGKVEFGYHNQTGRASVLNYSTRAEAERTNGINSYRLSARYLYGKSADVLSTDRQDASFRWRHEINAKFFGQAVTSYTSDKVTRIDLNAEQNAGIGYKLVQTERQKASIGGGLTVQVREAEGIEQGLSYLGEFFQDYTYKLNGRLTFLQDLNALYSPDGRARSIAAGLTTQLDDEAENYKVRFNSTLQGKLSEHISLNLRYEYEYDNAIINKDGRSDQRVTSSVGYSF
jgi:putative salt-induced outer membrane protein YdiY